MQTTVQTTVYKAGIAAGSPTGGVVLEALGPGVLPWAAPLLIAAALTTVAPARRHTFPAARGRA